jgi:hypothetical protein
MSKKLKLWEGEIYFTKLNPQYYEIKYRLQSYDNGRFDIKLNNFIFYHEFEFQGFSRGRSSVTADFISLDKSLEVSMFVSDLSEVINLYIGLKVLKGYFCFVKKGANYGIKYLGDKPPDSNLMVGEFDLDKYIGVGNE